MYRDSKDLQDEKEICYFVTSTDGNGLHDLSYLCGYLWTDIVIRISKRESVRDKQVQLPRHEHTVKTR